MARPAEPDEVLVVGAGPVGLTVAAELARQGGRATVVERLAAPTGQSRAVVVHPRTQEHLAAMGVLNRLERRSRPQYALEVFTGRHPSRPAVRLGTDHLDTRYQRILDVPQPDTEAVLAELATELRVPVRRGVTLRELTADDTGVDVTLTSRTGTERRRYGWVVGADGAHSTVRAAAGSRIDGVFHGQHFVLADVGARTGLSGDTVRMFAHPDGIGGVFPMPGGRTRLLFLVGAPAPGAEPALSEVQRLVDERCGGQWQLTDPHWLTYFEVHHGQVPAYRHGRVLLAGDAAHIHSPAGGQGMNTGIQDAVNLAWKLALVSTGRAGPALLDSYHAERHPVGAAVVKQTSRLTGAMTAPGGAVLRELALYLLGHLHAPADRVMTEFAEVGVGYRDSPIVGGTPAPGAELRPGDHAPDLPGLRSAAGRLWSLPRLLHRPGHVLLVRSPDPAVLAPLRDTLGDLGTAYPIAPAAPSHGLADPADTLAHRCGLGTDGHALIRPDGYLALTTTEPAPGQLAAHLARLRG